MYSTVIEIRNDIESDMLRQLKLDIESAFANRAGTVENISKEPYRFEFVGDEDAYGCLEIGSLNLKRNRLFWKHVRTWKWIDEDPDECCDLTEVYSKPVR